MPTITFTAEQFEALKNIINQLEHDEYKWVQENYEDCEDEDDDTPETIVAKLEKNGAGDCTYAHIQRVWSALNLIYCEKDKTEICKNCRGTCDGSECGTE